VQREVVSFGPAYETVVNTMPIKRMMIHTKNIMMP